MSLPLRTIFIALLAGLAFAAPASAARDQLVTFEAPRDLLDPSQRDQALAELDSLGVDALRVILYWRDVAPDAGSRVKPRFDETSPSSYDWSRYDAVLDAAKARGWQVLLTVSTPGPRWASNGARNHIYRPSPNEFRKFMVAVSRHVGDRATMYSIINEPNHPQFLEPQYSKSGKPLSPGIYRNLYAAALRGLDDAGDTRPVLMGETAPRKTGKVVAPLAFLRGVLCLDSRYRKHGTCSKLRVDGYAHHAYTTRSGPFFKPRGRDDVTIGVISRLTRALDRAARAGVVRKRLPVHLTEFGIQSTPDPIYGVSEQRQAEYRAISERIAWSNSRVATFSQYLLTDDNPVAGAPRIARYSGFESGLKTASGKPKLSYDGFRLPMVVKRTKRGVSMWGLVRPGSGPYTVVIEVDDPGKKWRRLATLTTDAAGYWTKASTYRSGRRWRVRWTSPSGTEYLGPPTRAYR